MNATRTILDKRAPQGRGSSLPGRWLSPSLHPLLQQTITSEVGWRRGVLRGHDDGAYAKTHKMMGKYKSEAEAKAAMATMKECGG